MFQYLAASSRPKGKVAEQPAATYITRSLWTKKPFWPWESQSYQIQSLVM